MSASGAVWRSVAAALGDADPAIAADPGFVERLRRYVEEIVAWGASIHLVGRGRQAEALAEQVFDSIAMLSCAEEALPAGDGSEGLRIADIGTGAGIPGIIWKLARPRWEIVLIERRERVAAFLRRAIGTLGIERADVFEGDARELREGGFDIVTSKAAGRFSSILPIAIRLGRPGGIYVTAKGDSWESELAEAGAGGFEAARVVSIGSGRGFAIALKRTV